MKAVDQNHFLLNSFAIIDDQGKKYSIEEFLDIKHASVKASGFFFSNKITLF